MICGLRILCKETAALSLRNGIHTSIVLFARRRAPRAISHEPELNNYDNNLETDSEFPGLKNEYDIDENFDLTKTEEAYDLHIRELKNQKRRNQEKIIAQKFFAPRPQPLMLTWNERQCIKFLHNKDPVQWNIKTLSESFPATPDTVKKIIKSRLKISPERVKLLDLKAQKNWELLAEGKLDADHNVLEHLKKFVNKREILLEQISNANFYLPEVKKEPVWNQGEMNKILVEYDKALSRLTAEAHQSENVKVLSDGVSEEKKMKEEKSNLDLIHEKIKEKSKKLPNSKDSFVFGKVINAFKKNITLEELEKSILKKADARGKLDLIEKAVLDSKLRVSSSENFNENLNEISNDKEYNSSIPKSTEKEKSSFTPSLKKNLKFESRINIETDQMCANGRFKINSNKDKSIPLDSRSQFIDENGIGKLLNPNVPLEKTKVIEEKPEIDFSDPIRLQNEKIYYDQQVSDIKNTAFWNDKRRTDKNTVSESHKEPVKTLSFSDKEEYIPKTVVFSEDVYPERIKIPKDKQGSGLTFRIKDCYYDDDGEFLYRVPGMIK